MYKFSSLPHVRTHIFIRIINAFIKQEIFGSTVCHEKITTFGGRVLLQFLFFMVEIHNYAKAVKDLLNELHCENVCKSFHVTYQFNIK